MQSKMESLNLFLLKRRLALGLTQLEVAKLLKYGSAQYISNWERGLNSPPMYRLVELAEVYKVNKVEFMNIIINETKKELEKKLGLVSIKKK